MENILAMQIVGAITVLIGLRMNMDPVGFNKDIFGDVEGVDSGEMSASRLAIGGGIKKTYAARKSPEAREESQAVYQKHGSRRRPRRRASKKTQTSNGTRQTTLF